MKRIVILSFLSFSLMFIFVISRADAIGLGMYYNLGWGSGNYSYSDDYYYDYYSYGSYGHDYDFNTMHSGRAVGFVFDTNVAKDRVFNYRLNFALDKNEIDYSPGPKYKVDGYLWDNIFGFGIVRTKYVRLWIGPTLNFSYYHDDIHSMYEDDDFDQWGIGTGPALGININLGDIFTITITNGYKYMWIFGSDPVDDFDGHEGQYYINFGMLFRIKDVYR